LGSGGKVAFLPSPLPWNYTVLRTFIYFVHQKSLECCLQDFTFIADLILIKCVQSSCHIVDSASHIAFYPYFIQSPSRAEIENA